LWGGLSDGKSSSSQWANHGDLRSLVVKRPEPRRLTLGRVGTALVAAEERQSVIVLGPTQSMKTSGLAIPAILEWNGPVVATSVKTDLLTHTIDERRATGQTWVYDPTSCTQIPTSQWSPLHGCGDWHGAQRTAAWLASSARADGSGLQQEEFWYASAAKLLAPLLFAAALSERTITDVVRWVNLQEEKEVRDALRHAGVPAALESATASFQREGRQRSSVYTTAETLLSAYEDPLVAASASRSDIQPGQLLDGGRNTLYVVAPSHEQQRLRPLFETLLHTVISQAFERSSVSGKPLDPALLVVLDEAANIAPLRDLDTLASTAAGHGIQLVSVFQDLSQISNRYGERAQTVVNNHRAKIVLSGISDTYTLEYASRLLGDEEVLHSSITRGNQGAHSTTESTTMRSLAPAHALRGIRPGEGVLVYGHLPPARLRLRPWFREKATRALKLQPCQD
jgi:type IV secretion system protein VirD4